MLYWLLIPESVLVRVMVETEHHDQKASWGGKGIVGLHFHIAVHCEGSQDRNSNRAGTWRQEMTQRPWKGAAYWHAPYGLLRPLSIEPRTTSPGMTPPTMG